MSAKNPSAPFTVEATNAASSTEPTATFAPRADHSVPLFASRTITVTESPAASRSRATTEPTCPVTPATTNFDIECLLRSYESFGRILRLKMPGAMPEFQGELNLTVWTELLARRLHLDVVGGLGDQLAVFGGAKADLGLHFDHQLGQRLAKLLVEI